MDLDRLKEDYGEDLDRIEDAIRKQKEIVERLYYLKKSGLYRKHSGYENKTFEAYLDEVLGMTLKEYEEMVWFINLDEGSE